MATAGTVTVDFAAETARFTQELKKVRSDLRGLKDETASIGKQLGTAGKSLLGFLSAGAVVAGVRSIIKATAEEQAAVAQLESALKTAGAQVGITSGQLTAFAAELQKTTTFADDAIIGVESILLSFRGLSGGVIQDATRNVLDLSTRMGVDLNSAAKLVGRALADPEKGLAALSRAGVTFSESQRTIIKGLVDTGDRVQAQALILRELESRYGGAAAAARNTLGGALSGLKNAFGDLLEARGGMPALTTAVNSLTDVLNDPGTKAGFNVVIEFLTGVVKIGFGAVRVIGEIGAGVNRLILGAASGDLDGVINRLAQLRIELSRTPDDVPALREQRRLLLEQIADAQAQLNAFLGSKRVPGRPQAAPVPEEEFTPAFSPEEILKLSQQVADARRQLAIQEFEENSKFLADLAEQRVKHEEDQLALLTSVAEQRRAIARTEFEENSRYLAAAAAQEFQFEQAKLQMRQATISATLGLLQVLAARSKTAAVALVLINRGLMIAQAIQNTSAAVMKAFALYGPTPQGFAAATAMKLQGALQVGIIAATGALEIGQISKGNSAAVVGPGTPNNPVRVDEIGDSNRAQQREPERARPVLHITAFGWDERFVRELTKHLREASGDYDLVLTKPNGG